MSGSVPAVGSSASSAARSAASPIAWTIVAIPTPCGPRRERREPLRRRDEDAALRPGRERPALLRLDRLEQGRRPRPERAVGEELQPAELGAAAASGQSGSPLRSPAAAAASSCSSRMQAWTRIGSVAALVERADRRRSRRRGPPERQPARVVDGDDAQADEVAARAPGSASRALERSAAGTWPVTSRAAVSWRTPLGSPPASRRIGRRPGRGVPADAGGGERRAADPERVVVVGPERDAPARRDRLEVVRGRPAAPAGRGPSRGPRASARRLGAGPRRRRSRRGPPRASATCDRSTWSRAIAALGEVEMGVGQARDRDLVGVQLEPDGVRVGPRLELDRRAGERDAAVG